ncbi:hypothetical protein BKA70DRAFT_1227687 [Coprinopsis sp. MPI-PUGE-AT-0042]|nr:hypothetical protein BKA70DRAFT_1227687 [Coprinopsis sp. MPI-PUGE-AT-0042]
MKRTKEMGQLLMNNRFAAFRFFGRVRMASIKTLLRSMARGRHRWQLRYPPVPEFYQPEQKHAYLVQTVKSYRVRMNTVDAFRVAGGSNYQLNASGVIMRRVSTSEPSGAIYRDESIPDHERSVLDDTTFVSHSKATRDHVKMVDVFRVVEACKVMKLPSQSIQCIPKYLDPACTALDVANQLWRWVERADRLKAASAFGGIVDHTVANTEQNDNH